MKENKIKELCYAEVNGEVKLNLQPPYLKKEQYISKVAHQFMNEKEWGLKRKIFIKFNRIKKKNLFGMSKIKFVNDILNERKRQINTCYEERRWISNIFYFEENKVIKWKEQKQRNVSKWNKLLMDATDDIINVQRKKSNYPQFKFNGNLYEISFRHKKVIRLKFDWRSTYTVDKYWPVKVFRGDFLIPILKEAEGIELNAKALKFFNRIEGK